MSDYFVKINNARTLRKELLEASKENIQVLLQFDKLKNIRENKVENINEAEELIKELKLIIQNMKKLMPRIQEPNERIIEVNKTNNTKKEGKSYDLNELEKELIEIEKKIKSI